MMMSTSENSGLSWSRPRIISNLFDRHKYTPQNSAFVENNGSKIILSIDYAPLGYSANEAGSGVFISEDKGNTWIDHISGKSRMKIEVGKTGELVAGFHINTVRLNDGGLLAMARTQGGFDINGNTVFSYSSDEGVTWNYQESPFPGIESGQRLVFTRLNEGPLLICSFTGPNGKDKGMDFRDAEGNVYRGYGLFVALSYDEGKTWPVRKLVSPGEREFGGSAWIPMFKTDITHAEPYGYLAATQSPDDIIHLISSKLYYRFNLRWIENKTHL